MYIYISVAILAQSQRSRRDSLPQIMHVKILDLEPSDFILFKNWFGYNKIFPIRRKEFKRLVIRAYRDWKALVNINSKIFKKRATEVWPWPERMKHWAQDDQAWVQAVAQVPQSRPPPASA